jgi:hypothetical protein
MEIKINIVKPFLPSLEEISVELNECLEKGLVSNNSKYVKC